MMKKVRLFDDYSALGLDSVEPSDSVEPEEAWLTAPVCRIVSAPRSYSVEPEEAERALRHYIYSRKHGMHVPDDLQKFILDGLLRQLAEGAKGWHNRGKGRPVEDHEWLDIWAWYCFYMDERFNSGQPEERYEGISAYLTKELISLRVEGVPGLSAASIRRMVQEFKKDGFRPSDPGASSAEIRDIDELNTMQARAFCRCTLGLDEDAANELAPRIVARWNARREKK